jgi:hypothetical protein
MNIHIHIHIHICLKWLLHADDLRHDVRDVLYVQYSTPYSVHVPYKYKQHSVLTQLEDKTYCTSFTNTTQVPAFRNHERLANEDKYR